MRRFAFVFAVLLCTAGCGTSRQVQKGIDDYNAADYSASMNRWQRLEAAEPEMNTKARVRYLSYRGLTHYHLFRENRSALDLSAAAHFLVRGKDAYERNGRQYLDPMTAAELNRALIELSAYGPAPLVVVLPPAEMPPAAVPAAPPRADADDDDDD